MVYLASALILYGIFLIGYYMAWTDFKPLPVTDSENENLLQVNPTRIEPVKKPYTDAELGLESIDEASLPADVQRHRLLMDRLQNYAMERPDGTADVLRSWLKE